MKNLAALAITLVISSVGFAKGISSVAGIELGGNGSFLFSDRSIQAFGVGAGYQFSAHYSMWTDRPVGAKLRVEVAQYRQEAAQKSATDYLLSGSSLKSMSQRWTLIGIGAEGHFEGHGQILFWEAMLGYAMGSDSPITVLPAAADQVPVDVTKTTRSGIVILGGVGIKRVFNPRLVGIMNLRTMLMPQTPYTSQDLVEKSFFIFPIMFNVGVEIPFDVGG
ncbi:MAG: hypothetical protein IT289_04680 [Oligoflexia bacterium]|nr:hypothetical protein [Oligoflexia bacterium]